MDHIPIGHHVAEVVQLVEDPLRKQAASEVLHDVDGCIAIEGLAVLVRNFGAAVEDGVKELLLAGWIRDVDFLSVFAAFRELER